MRTRLTLLLLGLLLLGYWYWDLGPGTPGAAPTDPETAVQDRSAELGSAEAAGSGGEAAATRAVLEARRTAAPGTVTGLRVLLRWHDGRPAAGVLLKLSYRKAPRSHLPPLVRRADEEGVVEYLALSPGEVSLRSARSTYREAKKVEVRAGEIQQIEYVLAEGRAVVGRVRDIDGRGLAGARIWMTYSGRGALGGHVVGRSGPEGRFELEAVPLGRSIGALKAGRSPAPLFDLDDADPSQRPIRVELRFERRGGGLRGRVLDPQGAAVEDAVVCLGAMPEPFAQRTGVSGFSAQAAWTPLHARTDAAGEYRIAGVVPGAQPLVVHKAGFATARTEVQIVAGVESVRDLRLDRGFTVSGQVSDAEGQPLAGAVVRAFEWAFKDSYVQLGQFDYADVFPYPRVLTDEKGRYRLDNLPAGEALLFAGRPNRMGKKALAYAKTSLTGAEGQILEWSPRVTGGLQLTGRCFYRDGKPMSGDFITALQSKTGADQVLITDQEGRFRFVHLEPVAYTLRLQYWKPGGGVGFLIKHGVTPGAAELRLVVPIDKPPRRGERKGRITGRIQDPGGQVGDLDQLKVVLQARNSWNTEDVAADGSFVFDKVGPGSYRVLARLGERVVVAGEPVALARDQELDVGTLNTVPGGSLRVTMQLPEGAPDPELRRSTLRVDGVFVSQNLALRPGKTLTLDNLLPGMHRIYIYGQRVLTHSEDIEIQAGRTTEHTVRLKPALLHKARVHFATEPPPESLSYVIRDAAGKIVREQTYTEASLLTSPRVVPFRLQPGSYRLEFSTKSGLAARISLEVADLSGEPRGFEVRLK